jgi:hypothetical protein
MKNSSEDSLPFPKGTKEAIQEFGAVRVFS